MNCNCIQSWSYLSDDTRRMIIKNDTSEAVEVTITQYLTLDDVTMNKSLGYGRFELSAGGIRPTSMRPGVTVVIVDVYNQQGQRLRTCLNENAGAFTISDMFRNPLCY